LDEEKEEDELLDWRVGGVKVTACPDNLEFIWETFIVVCFVDDEAEELVGADFAIADEDVLNSIKLAIGNDVEFAASEAASSMIES
jgi:hypothetical protein